MSRWKTTTILAGTLALAAVTAGAQDFEFDLQFDQAEGAQVAPVSAVPPLRFSTRLSYGAVRSPAGNSARWSLRLNADGSHKLGLLGNLDWAGHMTLPDLAAGSAATVSLDRLEWQNSAGALSVKVGKYRIGWGEFEGVPVLDVLNPGMDFTTLGSDSAALPGQWFGSAEYFGRNVTVSGFVGLKPDVAHVLPPAPGTGRGLEYGLKAEVPAENGQVSLYAARLLPQAGVVDVTTMTSHAAAYDLLGVSANRGFGPVLLEFDLAAKKGLLRTGPTGLVRRVRIDAALGIEWALAGGTRLGQLVAAVSAQHWLGANAGLMDFGPAGVLPGKRTNVGYLLSYSTNFVRDSVSVSANVGGALDGSLTAMGVNVDYTVSDAMKLSASVSRLLAGAGGLYAPLNGTRSVGFSAEFFF